MSKERYKVSIASMVILEKEEQIFLTRRINTGWEDGKYTVPSGHVEPGETPKEAAIRETKEEVGVDIDKRDLELVHVDFFDDYLHLYFRATKWDGEPKVMEPDKCDHIYWASYDDLPENIAAHGAEVLEAIKNKVIYSEYD